MLDARLAPGAPSNATRVALSLLAAEPLPPVTFVRRHVYWKHGVRPDGGDGHMVDDLQVARYLAGPGGGYAGWTAGWACWWTRHDAHNFDVAVIGRPSRRFAPNIYFCSYGNEGRKPLTWDEVTLMEAVLGFVRTDGFDVLAVVADPHRVDDGLFASGAGAAQTPRGIQQRVDRLRRRARPQAAETRQAASQQPCPPGFAPTARWITSAHHTSSLPLYMRSSPSGS